MRNHSRPRWLEVAYGELDRSIAETPAEFVVWCLEAAGYDRPSGATARSLCRFGEPVPRVAGGRLKHGAIAIFRKGSSAHEPAGFVVGENSGHVLVLGRSHDAVNISSYPTERLLGVRWPVEPAL